MLVSGTTTRAYTHDAAGNTLTDTRSGSVYAYTYNKANRLKTVSYEGNLRGTYTYNGNEQLITRVVTNLGTSNGTIHTVHDSNGNIIAELNGTGQTVREYIWLPEAEIAPTFTSRAVMDRPMAVVDGVNTATPLTYMVHSDHLHRPIAMTDAGKVQVWSATWLAWGAPHSLTGSAALDARFPGQWFQLEAGLYYNWHRHYDPAIGRYTQPDPLGFVDGPSVYAYARTSPLRFVDKNGRNAAAIPIGLELAAGPCAVNPVICAGIGIVIGAGLIGHLVFSDPGPDECPIPGAYPGRETKGRTKQYEKPGDIDTANEDFDNLAPAGVRDLGGGRRSGTLGDGRTVTIYPNSSGGTPSIEIQSLPIRVKIRYVRRSE